MSHTIYQTRALVLGAHDFKESNKLIALFTREFGLIYAHAQSVRDVKSKMRFHTQTLSFVDVDLVSGRDMWRMTGIHSHTSGVTLTQHPLYSIYIKIADTLKRLLRGEDAHKELFFQVEQCIQETAHETDTQNLEEIEIIIMIRILHHVGYW